MKNTPIERKLIDETIEDFHIADFAKASRSGFRCRIYKNGNGSSRTASLSRRCKGGN